MLGLATPTGGLGSCRMKGASFVALLMAAALGGGCGGAKGGTTNNTTIVVGGAAAPTGPDRVYRVPSGSMEPTYTVGEKIMVNAQPRAPAVGHVVIFLAPDGALE